MELLAPDLAPELLVPDLAGSSDSEGDERAELHGVDAGSRLWEMRTAADFLDSVIGVSAATPRGDPMLRSMKVTTVVQFADGLSSATDEAARRRLSMTLSSRGEASGSSRLFTGRLLPWWRLWQEKRRWPRKRRRERPARTADYGRLLGEQEHELRALRRSDCTYRRMMHRFEGLQALSRRRLSALCSGEPLGPLPDNLVDLAKEGERDCSAAAPTAIPAGRWRRPRTAPAARAASTGGVDPASAAHPKPAASSPPVSPSSSSGSDRFPAEQAWARPPPAPPEAAGMRAPPGAGRGRFCAGAGFSRLVRPLAARDTAERGMQRWLPANARRASGVVAQFRALRLAHGQTR